MHDDLRAALDRNAATVRAELERLVRIPSITAPGYDPGAVRRSAEATAQILRTLGLTGVRVLDLDGMHPAVFGERSGPPGSPTVLLYAHHDVQPPGEAGHWTVPCFEPVEREGRLYGRGACDDKAGIAVHVAALRAHRGTPPVGIKVFIEGEEEIGSPALPRFFEAHGELIAADVAMVPDGLNWRLGQPAVTTSMRGLVDCILEVRTLRRAVHSGVFGGTVPDALMALVRLLSTLHDEAGRMAVPWPAHRSAGRSAAAVEMDEPTLRERVGTVEGLRLIGDGSILERLWGKPALSILAVDAPRTLEASNQLVPAARAKLSLRIPPGADPDACMRALISHVRSHVPWGAQATVMPGATVPPFALDETKPAYESFRQACVEAWGHPPVHIGEGGSIPFVAAFQDRYPDAAILVTGIADPESSIHGPDESLHLADFARSCLAEAVALRLLGA